jgi:hypothetical protein
MGWKNHPINETIRNKENYLVRFVAWKNPDNVCIHHGMMHSIENSIS